MDTIIALIALGATLVAGIRIGRWWQSQQDPLTVRGKLLDESLKLAKQLSAITTGDSAAVIEERKRQARVLEDIKAEEAKLQSAGGAT